VAAIVEAEVQAEAAIVAEVTRAEAIQQALPDAATTAAIPAPRTVKARARITAD